MANWMRTLDISDSWEKALLRQISPQDLAKTIADKLSQLIPFNHPNHSHIDIDKKDLIEIFNDFSKDPHNTFDDFDVIMKDLYDWADEDLSDLKDSFFNKKRVCWIKK